MFAKYSRQVVFKLFFGATDSLSKPDEINGNYTSIEKKGGKSDENYEPSS